MDECSKHLHREIFNKGDCAGWDSLKDNHSSILTYVGIRSPINWIILEILILRMNITQ